MSHLNVRYPTGHLEVFPVKPQAPLISVFEAACAKRSLDPKAHKLVYKKRTVDLSLPFMYSGLTNRATLELVAYDEGETVAKPSTSTVRIGIRLEDGHRAECSGHASSSIWSILESLASHDKRVATLLVPTTDGLVPTVVYLQNQISGEESLRETTLDSLGIRGSALFQLHHGPPQPLIGALKGSPSAGASLPTAGKEQPPPTSAIGTSQPTCEEHLLQGESTSMLQSGRSSSDTGASESSPPAKRPPPPPASQPLSSLAPVAETSQPTYKQHLPQGESASIIFPSGSGRAPGVGTSSTLEPFSIFASASSRSMFDPDESTREHPKKSITVGEMIGVSLEPDAPTSAQQGAMLEHTPQFKFPTETEGQDLLHLEEAGGSSGTPSEACEREEVIFQRQTSVLHDTESEELSDEYFQLTERELRLIISDLRKEAGTDVLLGERSVQRSAGSARINCQRCIIRFTWPDDICLQACFRPQEHVSALYEFIRERLANRDLPFKLFTAPPRVILSNLDETLIQAHLVPSSRVHMTSQSAFYKAKDVLRADVLANMKSSVEAGSISAKWMPKSPSV
ncbi:Tether containing UBX domain for GLUT4 [Taenia solium]|eukprot:TsM_000327600 transcript=TsM_000327600 gene=TsM_000327600